MTFRISLKQLLDANGVHCSMKGGLLHDQKFITENRYRDWRIKILPKVGLTDSDVDNIAMAVRACVGRRSLSGSMAPPAPPPPPYRHSDQGEQTATVSVSAF